MREEHGPFAIYVLVKMNVTLGGFGFEIRGGIANQNCHL
jgi:hypothetical protein